MPTFLSARSSTAHPVVPKTRRAKAGEKNEEEEEFDDSYVEVSSEDTRHFFQLKEDLKVKITEFGVYMRDHEVKKNLALEEIEIARQESDDVVDLLREKYNLDPNGDYTIEINSDGSGNLVFVKQ